MLGPALGRRPGRGAPSGRDDGMGTVRSVNRSMIGNGPIDNRPLNTHVVVAMPKMRPAMKCQRFQPE